VFNQIVNVNAVGSFLTDDDSVFLQLVIGYQKRTVPDPYLSFSNNINTCLFDSWVADGVLRSQVACDSQQLCYGRYDGEKALFAVCYNTETLIPEYTGNIVESGGTKGEEGMITPRDLYDIRWKTDSGLGNTFLSREFLSSSVDRSSNPAKLNQLTVTVNQYNYLPV